MYPVRLTVEDEEGAKDTDVVWISVNENLFSSVKNEIVDVTFQRFINGSIGDFLGDYIFSFLGSFLGKISGNLLANLVSNRY